MKQSNAPKNTKENMSCFRVTSKMDEHNVLCISKLEYFTDYYWLQEKRKNAWFDSYKDIGMWRLTKKRHTKDYAWEKVLDSKITNK